MTFPEKYLKSVGLAAIGIRDSLNLPGKVHHSITRQYLSCCRERTEPSRQIDRSSSVVTPNLNRFPRIQSNSGGERKIRMARALNAKRTCRATAARSAWRAEAVKETIAALTTQELERVCIPPDAQGHPTQAHPVLGCLRVILEEEWGIVAANRDLDAIASR